MPFRAILFALLFAILPTADAHSRPSPTPRPTATPVAGVPITVTGTIYALSCLLREEIRESDLAGCSRTSLAHGAALAIREFGSGRILGIAAESPAGDPAGKAREFIAEAVRIQGRLYRRGGFSILVSETIQALPAAPVETDAG